MSRRTQIREQRQRRRRRTTTIGVLVIVGVALVITAILIAQNNQPVGAIATPVAQTYKNTNGQSMGDPNAPVKIEEFSDFQCPYCKLFHDETFPRLVRDFVDTGKVYFTFRNFPVVDSRTTKKESHDAARAAVCAGEQGKFFEFHDLLFANQTAENAGDFSQRRLEAMAQLMGLDMAKFDACYDAQSTVDTVDQDKAAGLRANIDSTPSFLINGKLFLGAQAYEEFQKAIDAATSGTG